MYTILVRFTIYFLNSVSLLSQFVKRNKIKLMLIFYYLILRIFSGCELLNEKE